MNVKHREGFSRVSRLERAKEGLCNIVKSLETGDYIYILGFGSETTDISGGLIPINDLSKALLQQQIHKTTAPGQTKLYDTMMAGFQAILEISSNLKYVQRRIGGGEVDFWSIVVTDGDDTASKRHTFQDVANAVSNINRVVGSTLFKLAIIGVNLGTEARLKMEHLSHTGGAMATFADAKNLGEVTKAFNKLVTKLQYVRHRVEVPVQRVAIASGIAKQAPPIVQASDHVAATREVKNTTSSSEGSSFKNGSQVVLHGIMHKDFSALNGKKGVVKFYLPDSGRYLVKVEGRELSLRADRLWKYYEPQTEVILKGLNTRDTAPWNGKRAKVVTSVNSCTDHDEYIVEMLEGTDKSQMKAVKGSNMMLPISHSPVVGGRVTLKGFNDQDTACLNGNRATLVCKLADGVSWIVQTEDGKYHEGHQDVNFKILS